MYLNEYILLTNNIVYLCRESVSLDAVLGSVSVLGAVVQEDLLDLVAVSERAARYVDGQRVLRPGVRPEHQRLASIMQHPRYL